MNHAARQRRGDRYLHCHPRDGREAEPFPPLRLTFVCALLVAIAGCRFNVEPAKISLAGSPASPRPRSSPSPTRATIRSTTH